MPLLRWEWVTWWGLEPGMVVLGERVAELTWRWGLVWKGRWEMEMAPKWTILVEWMYSSTKETAQSVPILLLQTCA